MTGLPSYLRAVAWMSITAVFAVAITTDLLARGDWCPIEQDPATCVTDEGILR